MVEINHQHSQNHCGTSPLNVGNAEIVLVPFINAIGIVKKLI